MITLLFSVIFWLLLNRQKNPMTVKVINPSPRSTGMIQKYNKYIVKAMMEKMNTIKLEYPATLSKSEALQYVNDLSDILCSAMHECASKCMAKKPPDKGNHKKWWWNDACTSTRNRNRFYHHIWKSLNRPTSGEVYKCYKASRKAYRKACRDAVNCQYKNKHKLIDRLFKEKRNGQFWNLIRKSKQQCLSTSAINIETLEIYFRDKFKKSEIVSDYVQAVTEEVDQQYASLCADGSEGFHRISDAKIRKYITKLKRGYASGHDGILAEHLKNAVKTKLVLHLSNLLSICVTHGIVPDSFLTGTLVNILKKVNADLVRQKVTGQ